MSPESFSDVFAAPRETTDAERERDARLIAEVRPILARMDAADARYTQATAGGNMAAAERHIGDYDRAEGELSDWRRAAMTLLRKTERPNDARGIVDYVVARARTLNQPDQPTDNHGEPIDGDDYLYSCCGYPSTGDHAPQCFTLKGAAADYAEKYGSIEEARNETDLDAFRAAAARGDVPCAFCGKPSGVGAQICPACMGAAIDSDPGEANEPSPTQPDSYRGTCYVCGASIEPGHSMCDECMSREP